jgi:hypothetical protein
VKVTTQILTAVTPCAPAAVAGAPMAVASMPYSLAGSPSHVRETIQMLGGEGLLKRSNKHFGTRIDANVWPLGPRERSSG